MKIVAGLGSADAYDAYVDAGADELFCGYVPERWAERYGMALPLNRREVRCYPVQIGAWNEMERLAERMAMRGVPVTVTLNSLHYIPEQYPLLTDLVRQCAAAGFRSFIVADLALLVYLHQAGLDQAVQLHVSGEMGENNRGMITLCRKLGASRIILHRKVALPDMAKCIQSAPGMEFEAFALNEMCHFNGAFCQSLHCDELAHMCRVPYRIGGLDASIGLTEPKRTDVGTEMLGASGCGLCALWKMRAMGVTHLKLVGRGNHVEAMIRDIAAMRQALTLLDHSPDEKTYQQAMLQALFPEGCSGQCYYR